MATVTSSDDFRDRFSAVPISKIRTDGGTQPREEIKNDDIIEFAEAMEDGAAFPPVTLFYDGTSYWLADGYHRVNAAKRAGLSTIVSDVRMGGRREAVLHACGANAEHGLRRTTADKRRAVMRMLNDDEWGTWTDSRIAEYCKVTPGMVGAHRVNALNPLARSPYRKTIRDGEEVVVKTRDVARPTLRIQDHPVAVPAGRTPEPAQRTASNPIHDFARKLKDADIPFKENVKTDFGLVMFETDDAVFQVVPMLTASAFRDAFATILIQRHAHAPKKRAIIVGRVMEDARPWIARARHFKVEVKGMG